MNAPTNKTAIDAQIEQAAQAIYEQFDGFTTHPWQPGGNSFKQDDARKYARAAIAALAPTVQEAEQGMPELPPLPDRAALGGDTLGDIHSLYKSHQMYTYGQACILADRARQSAGASERAAHLSEHNNGEDCVVLGSDCRMTGGICDCRSGGSYGGCRKEREGCRATPVAQDAAVQGSVDIPTWQERIGPNYRDGGMDLPEEVAMKAEIADLRAALSQRAAVAEVAPTYIKDADQQGGLCAAILQAMYKAFQRGDSVERAHAAVMALITTPTASTPPAPAEKGEMDQNFAFNGKRLRTIAAMAGRTYDDMSDEQMDACRFSILGDIRRSLENLEAAPAPSEPAPQGVPEGWKLVPIEPTDAMVLAPGALRTGGNVARIHREIWSRMLAAAPAPAATSGGEAVEQSPYEAITLANLRAGKLSAARLYVGYCELSGELQAAKGAIKRYQAAPQPRPATIDLGHGATLKREAKTTGAVGWLMYNEHGLVRSLTDIEISLVEAVRQSLPAASNASVRDALHVAASMGNVLYNLAQRQGYVLTDADCKLYSELRQKWDAIRTLISKEK